MPKLAINISDVFNLTGAVIYNPDDYKPATFVSIDSRKVKKNTLFVAIKGEKFDGHKFVHEAAEKGASAVVVNKRYYKKLDKISIPIITVTDTVKAYGELANIWRHKLGAKVISITGSNGKTGTKDILAELLSAKYKVVKTVANNNNHIGVPLTILSAKYGTEILVLEHGTNHFGEIEYTAKIAEPDIAVITNIGESHLEFLIDKQGVYEEKSKLIETCLNNEGTIVCNQDDKIIKKETRKITQRITYGFRGKPEFRGKIKGYDEHGRTKLNVQAGKINFNYLLPLYGEASAKNFLAAFAIARRLGVSKSDLAKAVKKLKPAKGRLNVTEFKKNILIDDTYNSNPVSVESAVNLVKRIKVYKNSLLILGDMFELGKDAQKMHKDLSDSLKKLRNAEVLTLGKLMKSLADELVKSSIQVKHFRTRLQLEKYLKEKEIVDYKILVKGSRGMKMEDFVEVIKSKVA